MIRHIAAAAAAVVIGFVGACGDAPPPCTLASPPPPWDVSSTPYMCNPPPSDWPSGATEFQYDVEWSVYDSEIVFNNLTSTEQAQISTCYNQVRTLVITLDGVFVQSVNGVVAAGNNNWNQSIADLLAALTQLQGVFGTAPCSNGVQAEAVSASDSSALSDLKSRVADAQSQSGQ